MDISDENFNNLNRLIRRERQPSVGSSLVAGVVGFVRNAISMVYHRVGSSYARAMRLGLSVDEFRVARGRVSRGNRSQRVRPPVVEPRLYKGGGYFRDRGYSVRGYSFNNRARGERARMEWRPTLQ